MGTIFLVATVVLYVIALAVLVGCVLKNMFRSLFRGGVSVVLALVCIPLAMLISVGVGRGLGKVLESLVLNVFSVDAALLTEITEAFPSLGELSDVVGVLVAPLVFAGVYLILRAILGLIGIIVIGSFDKKPDAPAWLTYKHKAIGAGIGVACALVLMVAYMAPLGGFLDMGNAVLQSQVLDALVGETDGEVRNPEVDELTNTPVLSVTRALGGKGIFNGLTTLELAGEKDSLGQAVINIADLAGQVSPLFEKNIKEWGDEEVLVLQEALPAAFERVTLLRVLGAEGLSGLANSWLVGEDFVGIARPDMEGITASVVDSALLMFRDTTKDTIVQDLRGFAPMISIALQLSRLSDTSDLSSLLEELANAADTPEIKSLLMTAGVSILADELGLYNNKQAVYEDYTGSLAALSVANLSEEALQEEIKTLNRKFAVSMTDAEVAALAGAIKDTPYSGATAPTASATYGPVLTPCVGTGAWAVQWVDSTGDLNEWLSQVAGSASTQEGSLGWLSGEEDIPTALITAEELTALTSNKEAMDALTKDDIIALVGAASEMLSGGELTLESAMGALGNALNNFAATPQGEELVSSIVTGVLQSEKICASMGITPAEATEIAAAIKDSGSIKELDQTAKDLTNLMNVVNHLKDDSVSAGALTPEDFRALIYDMSDSSAKMLKSICTPEMLQKFGLPAASVKGTSRLLGDLLEDLVEARRAWTDEHYQKEADAIYRVLTLAMGAKSAAGNTFEERMGMSADEFVKVLAASELLTGTMPGSIDALLAEGEDPFGLSTSMKESDREELVAAIERERVDAPANTIALLDALLKMLGY